MFTSALVCFFVSQWSDIYIKSKGIGLESRYPRLFSRLYNYLPWFWNSHVYCLISPWGHATYKGNGFIPFTTFFSRSTRYQLLLGGQRRCGFKACVRLLHMTGAAGIEPKTPRSRVLRLDHSATRSTLIKHTKEKDKLLFNFPPNSKYTKCMLCILIKIN